MYDTEWSKEYLESKGTVKISPEDCGKKEALEYLEMYPTAKRAGFMDEGPAEIERDYSEKHAQERYIKAWNSAWDEYVKLQVERIATCDIDGDIATDKDDFASSCALSR